MFSFYKNAKLEKIEKNQKMLEDIDELIELNLKLLYNAPNKSMWRIDFRNEKGHKLKNSLRFAKIMHESRLIKLEPNEEFRCDLDLLGMEVLKKGGWIKHLESEKFKLENAKSREILEF